MAQESGTRILGLLDAATQAFERGQVAEGERFLRQAQVESPRHPLVQNELARRLLVVGNPAGAYELAQQAVKTNPSHPALWLTLAGALHGLNRGPEELAALDKALELDPRHVPALLQKAALLELHAQSRAAATLYRTALQAIPPNAPASPRLQPILQHATDAVAANHRALEAFLDDKLRDVRARHAGESTARVDRCVDTLLQKQRIYRQQPTFLYFPEMPPIEFYDRSLFPWLESIEAATDDIRSELLDVLAAGSEQLEPYVAHGAGVPLDQWRDLNNSRRWGVWYLWRAGAAISEHIERCPKTAKALEAWPRWEVPGVGPTAVFSILEAKTHIPAHTGVHNTRLTVHLPLIIPPGCTFRVGGQKRPWELGKAIVFDDSIEHEVWNESDVPRAVLIFDIWSPFLTPAERDLVSVVTSSVGEYYGTSLA